MQKLPQEELRERYSLTSGPAEMDQQAALRLKRAAAQEFRAQLTIGAPADEDEKGLRRLSAQLKAEKLSSSYSCAISFTPSCIWLTEATLTTRPSASWAAAI